MFEGGVKVHGFVHSTSDALVPSAARGTTYSELMHLVDLTPTLLEGVLGVRLDDAARADLDGVDQWRALTARVASAGSAAPRSELLLNIDYLDGTLEYSCQPLGYDTAAIIADGWKLVVNSGELNWYKTPTLATAAVTLASATSPRDVAKPHTYLLSLIHI